jgi:hypothetical protein
MSRRSVIAVLLVLGAIALIVWGFLEGRGEPAMEAELERPVEAPPRVSNRNGVPTITLDAATSRASGIEAVSLRRSVQGGERRAYGSVLDLQSVTDLSNSYANARAQLQTARAKLGASRSAFERGETLYKTSKLISTSDYQTLESAFRVDEATVAAAESQVRADAATAMQTWGAVVGRAIMDRSPLLARLIGRKDVLLQVTLPGSEVSAGPSAGVSIQAENGSRIPLEFVSVATKTEPSIQGANLFYRAPANSALLPGTKVLVLLPSGNSIQGVRVPASAVVWWQGRAWVYLRRAPGTFTREQIATDQPAAGGAYLVSTLPDPADIVSQGAQLLLSEELRAQVQVGEEGG